MNTGAKSRSAAYRTPPWRLLGFIIALLPAGCPSQPTTTQPPTTPTLTPTAKVELPDRSDLPKPGPAPSWAPPQIATWQMKNGMKVWHLDQRQIPLLSLFVLFPAGSGADPQGKAGLTDFMLDMLNEGAGDRNALELTDTLQRMATDHFASATTDGSLVGMNLLADQLGPSLAILADIIRRPTLPQAEFKRRKSLRIASLLAGEARPQQARGVVLMKALFGSGYLGAVKSGVRSTIKRITLADIKGQYRRIIQPEGATVVAVGAVDRATLQQHLDRHFGDWQGKPAARVRKLQTKAPTRGIYFIDYPGSTQSAIAVARRADNVNAPDLFPAMIYQWALGGSFGSRINLNLREDKGYTYGARAGFSRSRGAGMFVASAKVKADKTRASLDEIFAEIKGIGGDRPVTKQERSVAVNGLLLGFPGKFERMSSVSWQLARLILDGRDANWYRTYSASVEAVTLEQAQSCASRHAAEKDYLIVIAGDRKVVQPTLKGMDLPLFIYDAQGKRLSVEAPQ